MFEQCRKLGPRACRVILTGPRFPNLDLTPLRVSGYTTPGHYSKDGTLPITRLHRSPLPRSSSLSLYQLRRPARFRPFSVL
jgi:hypothetical protein